jgi:hypothetical protein
MSAEQQKIDHEFKAKPPGGQILGSFDDDPMARAIITDSIRRSARSRDQVADEMTLLLGKRITARMLNAFTSEANEQHRFPLCFTRAFCEAVQDWRLVALIAERSGLQLISGEEVLLLELGRQYFNRKQADVSLTELEVLIESGRKK